MSRPLLIIDSFQVTETLQDRLAGMSLGTWFVLEGQSLSYADLPVAGTRVEVGRPGGDRHAVEIAEVKISHGSAAMRFSPDLVGLPRLSSVAVL